MNRSRFLLLPALGLTVLLSTGPAEAETSEEAIGLAEALTRASRSNPNLLAGAESIKQAQANRDRAFALVQPTIRLGTQFRINDREISFNPGADFSGGSDELFSSIYGNFGILYESLFTGGLISPESCEEIASVNGFADCQELTDAFLSGEGLGATGGLGDSESEPIVIQPKEQFFVTAEVNWPLSPRVLSLARAGNHQVRAAREQARTSRDQVLGAVIRTYAQAYHSQQAVLLLEAQAEGAEAHLRDSSLLLEEGLVTRDVLLRARGEKARVLLQVAEVSELARRSRRALALLMGSSEVDFGRLDPLPAVELPDQTEVDWTSQAVERRPEVGGATAQRRAAKEMEVDAALQFLPSFALNGSWNWTDSPAGFDSSQSSWWVGIGASLPVWDGGLLIQGAREAASRKRQARQQETAIRQQVVVEAQDAFGAWSTARAALPVASLESELAAEAFRSVEARYRAGEARQVELLSARNANNRAELNLLLKEIEASLAGAALLAAGGELEAWIAGLSAP
ncbi:MAG: TolC family protein [Myxococcota bacterium]|nr:TolC family protein [Myxococcota bacterium]